MKFEEYFEKNRLSNIFYNRDLNDFMYPYDYCGKELECVKGLMVDSLMSYYSNKNNFSNGIMIITPFQVISSFFAEKAILHSQMFSCYNKILYQAPSSLINQNFYIRFYNGNDGLRASIEAPEIINSFQKKEIEKLNQEIKQYVDDGGYFSVGYYLHSPNDYRDIFGDGQINLEYNYSDDMVNLDGLILNYTEENINDNLTFGYDYFKDDYLIGRPIINSNILTVEQVLSDYFKYIIQNFRCNDIVNLLIDEFNKYKNYFETEEVIDNLLNYFNLVLDENDLSIIKDYLEIKCKNARKK